ncbi:MAG: hypothetical protein QXI58_00580 [Candidatus Micrarchaeia archaeon]
MIFDEFFIKKKIDIKEAPRYEYQLDVLQTLKGDAKTKYEKIHEFGRKDFYLKDDKPIFFKEKKIKFNMQPFFLLISLEDKEPILIYEFFLTGITEARREKYQLSLMVGDRFGYFFFGSMPKIVALQGVLFNLSEGFDWREKFISYYEENLRGTKLIENKYKLYLFFENVYIIGYPLDFTITQGIQQQELCPFSMNVLAIERQNLTIVEKNAD